MFKHAWIEQKKAKDSEMRIEDEFVHDGYRRPFNFKAYS